MEWVLDKVILIARRELNGFFSTWMGYIIGAGTLVINGLLFMSFAIGNKPKYSAEVLSDFFYFSSGIAIVTALFLSMRLFAEERQSGTITLYYTSPVTERQVVYGKFLSAVIFFLFLQLLSLYMPLLIKLQGKISYGHLVAGYLGTSLLGFAVIGLCLFASIVAANQLVAAILGAVFTVAFLVLWMLAGVVDQPFKDLFAYLAIHNQHFTPFSQGMIHIKDILFYVSFAWFFLEASVRTLEARRWQG